MNNVDYRPGFRDNVDYRPGLRDKVDYRPGLRDKVDYLPGFYGILVYQVSGGKMLGLIRRFSFSRIA